jgi:hypothetical protein
MNRILKIRRFLLLSAFFLHLAATSETQAQLSGTYRSAPGTLAMYTYHIGEYHTVPLPADVTMRFSENDPSSMTALIHKPIIGDTAENHNYGIVHEFPMVVTATSTDGHTFRGDLLGTQYLFKWTIEPVNNGSLHWEGDVGWAGGRVEHSMIDDARLLPVAPGDYNQNGTVDIADFVIWREGFGQSNMSPIGFLADGDGDGQVDQDDYNIWRANYGETTARGSLSSAGIPEPATWLMLVVASLPLLNAASRRLRA